MGTIIGWLVAKGLSERVARPLAHMLTVLAILVLCAAAVGLWLHLHDKGVVDAERGRVDARGNEGRITAAEEAAAESAKLGQQEGTTHDAIDDAGDDGPPSAAAVALGCDQLRRGRVATPPECGPGGGNGGEAPAHR